MKTKKITLYYSVTQKSVIPPGPGEIERKDQWIRLIQAEVESEWKPKTVRVTYQLYNPECDQQRKFLEGPVIDYWCIQSQEIKTLDDSPEMKKKARETLLDKTLGYDVELIDKTVRRRRSTMDFVETQQWHDFLEMVRETEFEPNGYEYPDSEYFWKLAEAYGYEKAKVIAIEKLKANIEAKAH